MTDGPCMQMPRVAMDADLTVGMERFFAFPNKQESSIKAGWEDRRRWGDDRRNLEKGVWRAQSAQGRRLQKCATALLEGNLLHARGQTRSIDECMETSGTGRPVWESLVPAASSHSSTSEEESQQPSCWEFFGRTPRTSPETMSTIMMLDDQAAGLGRNDQW